MRKYFFLILILFSPSIFASIRTYSYPAEIKASDSYALTVDGVPVHVFVRVKDDCVAVKAHLDYPDNVIVDSILVDQCVFWNAAWGNGLEMGFELHAAEVKNITFRDCDIIHVERIRSSVQYSQFEQSHRQQCVV